MPRTARRSLAAIAAAVSLQASLPVGAASAQGVRIFEEAPPLEVLRGIMVPESVPGLSRRIVITNPDRPPSAVVPAAMAAEAPPAAPLRRPQPQPQQVSEPGPVLASARVLPVPPAPAAAAPAPKAREAAPAPAPAAGVVGYRINFALNSDVVPQAAHAFLDRVGELMREQPQVKLRIEGHTDALGSDEYNLQLSMRRAVAVANHLVQRGGVDPARLAVLGKGEAEPLAENPFDAGNRRVQFLRVE
jgi:OmpA-OmpF porin, OOP family